MDFALHHKDVRNIAITGNYGAGKSSFLRTYFKGRKDVMWVSLASFLGGDATPDSLKGCDITHTPEENQSHTVKAAIKDEHLLEVSILQQIFYAETQTTLPFSRLRRTTGISRKRYGRILVLLALLCIGVLGVFQPRWFDSYLNAHILEWLRLHGSWLFWPSLVLLSGLACCVIWEAYPLVNRIRVHRIALKGVELELVQKGDESILNRHVDEILYFFESTNYSIVVFEDIDRFNNVDIFTKLREINLLLNGAKQIPEKRKPIRFIYALREDIFMDRRDKVKFFDFILPIVPIINASNSREILTNFLIDLYTENGDKAIGCEKAKMFSNVVQDIFPFLSDMRLVKNICNEFAIYKGQIPDCADAPRLLGMVVFKNFFPKEFAQLHSDEGILVDLVNSKASLLETRQTELVSAIETRKSRILAIRHEEIEDMEKLDLAYLGAFLKILSPNETNVRNGYQNYTLSEMAHNADLFKLLMENQVVSNYRHGPIEWSEVERIVDPNHTYNERVELVKDKSSAKIAILEDENENDSKTLAKLQGWSLSKIAMEGLLDENTIKEKLDHSSTISDSDVRLLLRLVAGGYIDEQYKYYISIFHGSEASRTRRDYFYEIDAMQGKEATIDLELDNPREVIKNLPLRVFETKAILNLSLFKELVQQKGEKYEAVIKLLATEDWDCCGFLSTFLGEEDSPLPPRMQVYRDIESANRKYVEHMLDLYWPDQSPRGTLYSLVGFYLRQYLENGEGALNPSVKRFLEEDAKVRKVLGPAGLETPEAFKQLINKAHLRFSTVDTIKINNEALCIIADDLCAYRLDLYNIERVVGVEHRQALQRANLSTIIDCGNATLYKYVQDNFESYVDNVYDKLECQQQEKTGCVLEVLNRPDLPTNTKKRFLDKQDKHFEIKNVQDIQAQDAVQLVLDGNFLSVSWENIVNSGIVLGSAEKVVSFVSAPAISDCLANMKCDLPWGRVYNVAKALAESNELADEALDKLLRQLPQGLIVDYQGTTATPLRVQLLVKSRRISFSTELYNRLKSSGTGSQTTLAALDFKEMDKALEKEEISPMDIEVADLFNSGLLSSASERIAFLRFADQIAKDEDLAATVANHISNSNYKKLPIPVLDASVEYVTPLSLQCKIIQHLGGSADEIRERLKKMEEPYKKLGELGCHPQIRKWDGMDSFLDFLKDNNIVSSVGDGNDGRIQVHTTKT